MFNFYLMEYICMYMKIYVYAENMLCEPSRLACFGGEKLKLHRIHNDETYFPYDKTRQHSSIISIICSSHRRDSSQFLDEFQHGDRVRSQKSDMPHLVSNSRTFSEPMSVLNFCVPATSSVGRREVVFMLFSFFNTFIFFESVKNSLVEPSNSARPTAENMSEAKYNHTKSWT